MSSLVLTITDGADKATHTIKLNDRNITIGRAKASTIRINAPSVSSNHATIKLGTLTDIGSTNGSLFNGKPMKKDAGQRIMPGSNLQFGEVKVKVTQSSGGSARGGGPSTKARGGGPSSNSGKFHKIFPETLLDNTGNKHSVDSLYGNIVGIFICAHWNGPSKQFVETLGKIYYDLQKQGKKFQVVVVPEDTQKNRFQEFFERMPPNWLTVSWTSKKKVQNKFKRPGGKPLAVPTLVLMDEQGNEISTAGRMILNKAGADGYPFKDFKNGQGGGGRGKANKKNKAETPTEDLSQSKRFGGLPMHMQEGKNAEDEKKSVEDLMEQEFSNIIGHDSIKAQLKQFHKKVQLDKIRQEAGAKLDAKRLYHMLFMGPPGTGKTTMANLVAKIMVKMGIIKTDSVVFVNNALDLLAGYVGQTAPKVDAKVEEAKGGVIFIDEAYSIVKSEKGQKDSFGKEAIETIMKHLDPPSCVFIFAGYEKEMEDFLKVNAGLSRRMPYRYKFEAYEDPQLMEIFSVVAVSLKKNLTDGCLERAVELLAQVDDAQKKLQNAGMIGNWVAFAQMERDDRIDIDEAIANPEIASLLLAVDFESCMDKLTSSN